jgi:hypothetical protein
MSGFYGSINYQAALTLVVGSETADSHLDEGALKLKVKNPSTCSRAINYTREEGGRKRGRAFTRKQALSGGSVKSDRSGGGGGRVYCKQVS